MPHPWVILMHQYRRRSRYITAPCLVLSAGRVQSVALRLICERELEIEVFDPQEYWSVDVEFATPRDEKFTARLTHLDGKKLEKLSLGNKDQAATAVAARPHRLPAGAETRRRGLRHAARSRP